MDYSLPGSSVHGILQARILEWGCPPPGDLPDPGIKPMSHVSCIGRALDLAVLILGLEINHVLLAAAAAAAKSLQS